MRRDIHRLPTRLSQLSGLCQLRNWTLAALLGLFSIMATSCVETTECNDPLEAGFTYHCTMDFDGYEREYTVYVPTTYTGDPLPLVLDLPGFLTGDVVQTYLSNFSATAERENFILVTPEALGIGGSDLLPYWNIGKYPPVADDVAFIRGLVAHIEDITAIDSSRIYASGLSLGGGMSHKLACEAADLFAAIAPIAFPIPSNPPECNPSRPISVFHFHSPTDLLVPYYGGLPEIDLTFLFPDVSPEDFEILPAPDSFYEWADINACLGEPEIVFQKGSSVCEQFSDCENGVEVTLCSFTGHPIDPTRGHGLYINADGIILPAKAWEFLSQHSLF